LAFARQQLWLFGRFHNGDAFATAIVHGKHTHRGPAGYGRTYSTKFGADRADLDDRPIGKSRQSGLSLPQFAPKMITGQYNTIATAADGCDAIVSTGLFPSTAAAHCVAEKLGLHYACVAFCPLSLPSHHHRPFPRPGHPLPPEVTDPRALWALNAQHMNALFGEAINTQRASIGLSALDNVRDAVFTVHPLLASDPVLWPWEPTDLCDPVQTGAWILPDNRPLPADLEAFLSVGEPPIYVGFGSIALQTAKDAAQVAIHAVRAQGRRVVLAHG
jgi:vancomycin aglycone glucosyltransferase